MFVFSPGQEMTRDWYRSWAFFPDRDERLLSPCSNGGAGQPARIWKQIDRRSQMYWPVGEYQFLELDVCRVGEPVKGRREEDGIEGLMAEERTRSELFN